MRTHLPWLTICFLTFMGSSCHTAAPATSQANRATAVSAWHKAARPGTNQIKVVSHLSRSELEAKVMWVLNKWQIEIDERQTAYVLTMPFDVNTRTMRLHVRCKDGEALVSGEYNAPSLNPAAYNWRMVTPETDLYWERVEVLASVLDHETLLYN